jgi:hypothetical protein
MLKLLRGEWVCGCGNMGNGEGDESGEGGSVG